MSPLFFLAGFAGGTKKHQRAPGAATFRRACTPYDGELVGTIAAGTKAHCFTVHCGHQCWCHYYDELPKRVCIPFAPHRLCLGSSAVLTLWIVIAASFTLLANRLSDVDDAAEDLSVDVPLIWTYLSEIIVPMLEAQSLNWTLVFSLCEPLAKGGRGSRLPQKLLKESTGKVVSMNNFLAHFAICVVKLWLASLLFCE